MQTTSQIIDGQIATLDRNLQTLRGHAEGLSLDAVTGNRAAGDELARVNSEIAGLAADREVLVSARRRAVILEADAADDAEIETRRSHLASARTHAADAVKAAEAMDAAISAFVSAAAALDAAEKATRTSYRHAGQNPDGRVGRDGASAHGLFLLARIADGTAKRRNDKSVSALVAAAWAELLEKETADA